MASSLNRVLGKEGSLSLRGHPTTLPPRFYRRVVRVGAEGGSTDLSVPRGEHRRIGTDVSVPTRRCRARSTNVSVPSCRNVWGRFIVYCYN